MPLAEPTILPTKNQILSTNFIKPSIKHHIARNLVHTYNMKHISSLEHHSLDGGLALNAKIKRTKNDKNFEAEGRTEFNNYLRNKEI